jgi:hypothetical protein
VTKGGGVTQDMKKERKEKQERLRMYTLKQQGKAKPLLRC